MSLRFSVTTEAERSKNRIAKRSEFRWPISMYEVKALLPNECDATNIKSTVLGKCENIYNGKLLACGRVRRAFYLSVTSLSLLVLCIISVTRFFYNQLEPTISAIFINNTYTRKIHSLLCDHLPRFTKLLHCVKKK